MPGFDVDPREVAQHVVQAADCGGIAAGDVIDACKLAFRLAGSQVGVDNVVYVAEIARLFAISVDFWGFALQQAVDKQRYYRRVLGRRVLPRSEYVEVSQTDDVHLIELSENACVHFHGRFRYSVGRCGVGSGIFPRWNVGPRSVHG